MNDDDPVRARLAHLAEREFNAGTFEKVLSRRDERLRDHLDIGGCDDPEEKCAAATKAVLSFLEDRTVLRASAIDAAKLEELARHFAINQAIERSGSMAGTDDPGLPMRNLASYFWKIVDLLRRSADVVETREGIEAGLADRRIGIRDSDTTRLLVYEINKDALVPRVIVIPNDYKRYNPFYALFKADAPMTTTVMRVLRAFSR